MTESAAGNLRYTDNRPGLDWHFAQMGDATSDLRAVQQHGKGTTDTTTAAGNCIDDVLFVRSNLVFTGDLGNSRHVSALLVLRLLA